MKITLTGILLMFLFQNIHAQSLEGRYEGALVRAGSIQGIGFEFFQKEDSIYGRYEIPEAGLFDVPLNDISISDDRISISFYYGQFQCILHRDLKQITGTNEKWNPLIRLHVKKVRSLQRPYTIEQSFFYNKKVRLAGMIYHPIPQREKTNKYVVLIHGSGDQDRYAPYYISLAHSLAQQGIGVLLYDKRGCGLSSGQYSTASMDDLAEDASAAFHHLKSVLPSENNIGFLGTSQGGWIAPLAASKVEECQFVVLNAGPSVSVSKQDAHRIQYGMLADGWPESTIDSALHYTKIYFDYVQNPSPELWTQMKKMSHEYKSLKWASYINLPNKEDFQWWRINNFDPAEFLEGIHCPVLSIFGEFDPLVPPKENKPLMHEYLSRSGVEFDIVVIDGVGHDMKTYHGLNGDNWHWPHTFWQWRKEPEIFLQSICNFIDQI